MSQKDAPKTFEYLQELFQHSSRVVFAYHVESNSFSYLNPAIEKIWNLSADEASANPVSLLEAVHPEDKAFVRTCYGEILAGKEKEMIEFREKHRKPVFIQGSWRDAVRRSRSNNINVPLR